MNRNKGKKRETIIRYTADSIPQLNLSCVSNSDRNNNFTYDCPPLHRRGGDDSSHPERISRLQPINVQKTKMANNIIEDLIQNNNLQRKVNYLQPLNQERHDNSFYSSTHHDSQKIKYLCNPKNEYQQNNKSIIPSLGSSSALVNVTSRNSSTAKMISQSDGRHYNSMATNKHLRVLAPIHSKTFTR